MSKKKMVTLRLPQKSWELLAETLTLDAKSKAFDKALRRRIREALDQVQDVCEPYVLVLVYAGTVSKVTVFWSENEAIKAAQEEVKELREEYDILVVEHGNERVYGWPEG